MLRWYDHAQRDLPWRRPGVTPWQILVSEFMLQQTPVARVEPIWLDWVARWPTPSATAAAGAADVLRAWGKLGYPRRAKRLHECAVTIASEHGDVVPCRRRNPADAAGCRRLHGPGHRLFRLPANGCPSSTPTCGGWSPGRCTAARMPPRSPRDLADVAALLPNDAEAPRFSVALMELGATVCTARSPRCGLCPLSACAWRSTGYPPAATAAAPRPAVRRHRPAGPRAAAGCVARQRLSGHPRTAGRGLADRHRAARPRAGLAAGRRAGRADGRRPVRAGRRGRRRAACAKSRRQRGSSARARAPAASRSRSRYGSSLTSTATPRIVPPVNGAGFSYCWLTLSPLSKPTHSPSPPG